MWRLIRLAVLSLFVLGHVSPGCGQFDGEFPRTYNLPKMLASVGSILSTSQDIEDIRNDPNVISIYDQYNYAFSDGAAEDYLIDLLGNSGDERCSRDIQYVFQNLQAKDQWGLKMLDAMGKPESGILEGNVKWMGSFHECTSIYVPLNENATAGDFNGQYCTLGVRVNILNRTLPVTLGVCLPESCGSVPAENFNTSAMGSFVNITQKSCQPVSKKVTSAAIGMIFLLSIFVLLALIGSSITVYDYIVKIINQEETVCEYSNQTNDVELETRRLESANSSELAPNEKESKGWETTREFFNCFCILTNGEKLLNTDNTEGQLLCLHGVRFLSMTWVIVCHTYSMVVLGLSNVLEAAQAIDTWLFQIILSGYFAVDSFFLLSGFLVGHLYFQETAKTKKDVPWLYFYIHRYIRLTPVYMMVIGFTTSLSYYLGSGPLWPLNEIEPVCQKNWWYNMLYINNLVPHSKQCMGYTWYLANDMQFFIVSPLLLITLRRWPSIGYSILGLFMSVTIAANIGVTFQYSLQTGYGAGNPASVLNMDIGAVMEQQNTFYEKVYIKPYTRMSPYLIGIALAYYLFKRKQDDKGKLNRIILACGWIVTAAIALTCQFCLYHKELSVTETAFYNALTSAGIAIGLAWVIFTCLNGQAGIVNSILSFKLFIPLSRVTYSAYLLHLMVVSGYFQALKTTFQFSQMTVVITYLGLLLMTYAFAFIVSALFESPVIRLEKLLRKKLKS